MPARIALLEGTSHAQADSMLTATPPDFQKIKLRVPEWETEGASRRPHPSTRVSPQRAMQWTKNFLGPPPTIPPNLAQAGINLVHAADVQMPYFDIRPWRPAPEAHKQIRTIAHWMLVFVQAARSGLCDNCRMWIELNKVSYDWNRGVAEIKPLVRRVVIPQFQPSTWPDGDVLRPVFDDRSVSFHWPQYWQAIMRWAPTQSFPPACFLPSADNVVPRRAKLAPRDPDACFIAHNGKLQKSRMFGGPQWGGWMSIYMFVFAWTDSEGKAFLLGAKTNASGGKPVWEVNFGQSGRPCITRDLKSIMKDSFAEGMAGLANMNPDAPREWGPRTPGYLLAWYMANPTRPNHYFVHNNNFYGEETDSDDATLGATSDNEATLGATSDNSNAVTSLGGDEELTSMDQVPTWGAHNSGWRDDDASRSRCALWGNDGQLDRAGNDGQSASGSGHAQAGSHTRTRWTALAQVGHHPLNRLRTEVILRHAQAD